MRLLPWQDRVERKGSGLRGWLQPLNCVAVNLYSSQSCPGLGGNGNEAVLSIQASHRILDNHAQLWLLVHACGHFRH